MHAIFGTLEKPRFNNITHWLRNAILHVSGYCKLRRFMTDYDWLHSADTIKRSKKPYAHFDLRTDIGKQAPYISNPHKVATHGFYPFIHYKIKMTKFNKDEGTSVKERDICYAAHIDRCIFQYYSFILNRLYNERVLNDGLSDVAIAYRTNLYKSNIHFSKKAFSFIRMLGDCYIMIGDFTHFFDNLDHKYLKQQWCFLLNCEYLPDDHYSIFKNITSYSKWELTDLLTLNNLGTDRKGRKSLNQQTRVLTPTQFKEHRSHIIKNINHYGIPQGSSISAVLANVYMLEVDKLINDIVAELEGLYMRYSDDFIIILPSTPQSDITSTFSHIHSILNHTPRLILEPKKTQYFHYSNGTLDNCGKSFHSETNERNSSINFLGFTFDGQKVSIRAKTISKYYYRMYRKAKNIAKAGGFTRKGNHISCENLYRRYSERGASRSPGNFLTYVSHAEKEYGPNEVITRDTKRHMQKIRKALKGKKKN